MDSILFTADFHAVVPCSGLVSAVHGRSLPCTLTYCSSATFRKPVDSSSGRRSRRHQLSEFRRPDALTSAFNGSTNSVPTQEGIYTVGDFMTGKEHLHVVKPTTTVDEALETLVEKRITGFPVIDDDWKLVGVVSDYDLLALDSISGIIKVVDSMIQICFRMSIAPRNQVVGTLWKPELTNFAVRVLSLTCSASGCERNWSTFESTFNEIQKLLSKTNGKVIGDLMTPAPLVVRENTNLEDAVRLLLKTKYRRLPVVDGEGKLVGIITRGNVVRAALQIKQASEKL